MDINKDILIQSIEASNLAHTISSVDDDMPLIYVNQAFLDQTGYSREEVIGHNCRFLQGEGTDPETVQKIRQSIMDVVPLDIEILNYRKDKTTFWNRLRMAPVFDAHGELSAFIGIQSDVTHIRERQRLEEERQKLEALGRLSANISHEIKNAIQPVKLMAETLLDHKDIPPEQADKCIRIIHDNIHIADKVTRDVLRFSRKMEDVSETVSAAILSEDLIRFTQNLLNSRIRFTVHSDELRPECSVRVNQNQLMQVVLNIVNNALYAMENKGLLHMSFTCVDLDAEQATAHNLKAGSYLCIELQDDGCGMDDKVLQLAFDPFYSTKPVGEGTGLGLSISRRILRDWGGTLSARSAKGKGSTFHVWLPVVE